MAGLAASTKHAAGFSPIGRILEPYIEMQEGTEAGAFMIDHCFILILDRRAMTVNIADFFGCSRYAAEHPWFGSTARWPTLGMSQRPGAAGVVMLNSEDMFGAGGIVSTPIGKLSYLGESVDQFEVESSVVQALAGFSLLPTVQAVHGDVSVTEDLPPNRDASSGDTVSVALAALPNELTASYDSLLREIYETGIWSWRKLEPIMKASHTELQRIAKGRVPTAEVRRRIDALHRFVRALQAATRRDKTTSLRALSTSRVKDGMTPTALLEAGDFNGAYSAIMDFLSSRPRVAQTEQLGLRWYDRPSRPIHETDWEDEDDSEV